MLPHPALLLLGPTGAGKSPLGDWLAAHGYRGQACVHFDFGANLRAIVERDAPDAWISAADVHFLHDVLQCGALLEDEQFPLALRILLSFLQQRHVAPGTRIVLNGLPRHVGQAAALGEHLVIDTVVYLECSAAVVLQRIASNVGGDRAQRTDDAEAAVRQKLAWFAQRTAPLVEFYRRRGAAIRQLDVTASTTPQDVAEALARPGD